MRGVEDVAPYNVQYCLRKPIPLRRLTAPPVSLRLGHARVLTVHRTVIHYAHAASLPEGRGLRSPQTHYFLWRCRRGVEDVAPYKHTLLFLQTQYSLRRGRRRCRCISGAIIAQICGGKIAYFCTRKTAKNTKCLLTKRVNCDIIRQIKRDKIIDKVLTPENIQTFTSTLPSKVDFLRGKHQ